MKNIKSISLGLLTATIRSTGCTNQPQIMGSNSTKMAPVTMGIDRQDFEKSSL